MNKNITGVTSIIENKKEGAIDMKNELISRLEGLESEDARNLWSDLIFEGVIDGDEMILDEDDINDFFRECSPIEIGCRWFYGGGCPAHRYFKINAYGNIESSDFANDFTDFDCYIDEILEHPEILENYIDIDEFKEIFNNDEAEDEADE